MLLHALVLFPLIAGLVILLASERESTASARLAFIFSAIFVAMGLPLIMQGAVAETAALSWFTMPGTDWQVTYQLRADGLSAWLLQLVTLLTPVALVAAWRAQRAHMRGMAALIFICAGLMNGVLLATDLLVFYCFYEGMLIPMLLMIALYGDTDRRAAGIRFFIMTMLPSVLLLTVIWYLAATLGSTDMQYLIAHIEQLSATESLLLFLACVLAFAVKVPLFPLHGWQAPVYAAAPAAGSILLGGAMAKIGIYGYLRIVMPFFPDLMQQAAPYLIAVAAIGVIYGGFMALAQKDVKRLMAFSSMSHLGMIALGCFVLDGLAFSGVLVAMIAHGLSVAALFLLLGWLEHQRGHRLIDQFGGLSLQAPLVASLLVAAALALVALPGTAGFVGEFSILAGAARAGLPLSFLLIVGTTVIIGAWYTLRMIQRVAFGPALGDDRILKAKAGPEALMVIVLLLLSVVLGFYAQPVNKAADESLKTLVAELPLGAVGTCSGCCPTSCSESNAAPADQAVPADAIKNDAHTSVQKKEG